MPRQSANRRRPPPASGFVLRSPQRDGGARLRLLARVATSPSELLFPDENGNMRPRQTALEDVLRRAMRRAAIVIGYVHRCRRQGCGHREPPADTSGDARTGHQTQKPLALMEVL